MPAEQGPRWERRAGDHVQASCPVSRGWHRRLGLAELPPLPAPPLTERGCDTAVLPTARRTPKPALRGGGGSEPGRAEPGRARVRSGGGRSCPGTGAGLGCGQAAPLLGGPVLGGERMEREITGG